MSNLKNIFISTISLSLVFVSFFSINVKAKSIVTSTNQQLPAAYSLCVGSSDDPLYLWSQFASGEPLDGSEEGEEYGIIAVNNIYCSNANADNSSVPEIFFVYKNHDTLIKIIYSKSSSKI